MFALFMLTLLGAVATANDARGRDAEGVVARAHRAENTSLITVHYDCDGSIDPKFSQPVSLGHNAEETIGVGQWGMTYFTVTTDVFKNGAPYEKTYHVVLGSRNQEGARATIYGPRDENDEDAVLIRLEKGWVWASSHKPSNWIGTAGRSGNVRVVDAGGPGRPGVTDDPAVAWNPYRLIRVNYTWGGAEATEYIYHLEQRVNNLERAVIYNLDAHTARHTSKQVGTFRHKPVQEGYFSVATGKGDLGSPKKIVVDKEREAFVNYVRCRLKKITEPSNKNHCKAQHDEAVREDCSPSK